MFDMKIEKVVSFAKQIDIKTDLSNSQFSRENCGGFPNEFREFNKRFGCSLGYCKINFSLNDLNELWLL